jgi:hypothetical protein
LAVIARLEGRVKIATASKREKRDGEVGDVLKQWIGDGGGKRRCVVRHQRERWRRQRNGICQARTER